MTKYMYTHICDLLIRMHYETIRGKTVIFLHGMVQCSTTECIREDREFLLKDVLLFLLKTQTNRTLVNFNRTPF